MTIKTKIFGVVVSLVLAVIVVGSWPHTVAAESVSTAEYTIVWEAVWSEDTHPYPTFPTASAHFSPLIGAVHSDQVTFWQEGQLASAGIENMAELGGTSALQGEVQTAVNAGTAQSVLFRSGNIASPGTASMTGVSVSEDYPLITLVSMIAPSPDWFSGVGSLSLLDENGAWLSELTLDLYPYDAGTEEGTEYSLSNPPTNPPEPIANVSGVSPFSTAPVVQIRFVRTDMPLLTVEKVGNGSGTVSSSPEGINCGDDCSESYAPDSVVALTAAAETGSSFTGWEGGCSGGMVTCTVMLNSMQQVTATFVLNSYDVGVTLAGNGAGTVQSEPMGIDCGTDCSESYLFGTAVTLTATAEADANFMGWQGACEDVKSNICTFTVSGSQMVTATFTVIPDDDFSLFIPFMTQ